MKLIALSLLETPSVVLVALAMVSASSTSLLNESIGSSHEQSNDEVESERIILINESDVDEKTASRRKVASFYDDIAADDFVWHLIGFTLNSSLTQSAKDSKIQK